MYFLLSIASLKHISISSSKMNGLCLLTRGKSRQSTWTLIHESTLFIILKGRFLNLQHAISLQSSVVTSNGMLTSYFVKITPSLNFFCYFYEVMLQ